MREAAANHLAAKLAGGEPYSASDRPFGLPTDPTEVPDNPIPKEALEGFPQTGEDWPACACCSDAAAMINPENEEGGE